MANKQETDWMAKIISAIILAIAVYLIFRPVSYLLKSWKIQKENKATIQGLHHNPGDFWLTEQEKQQFLFTQPRRNWLMKNQRVFQLSAACPPGRPIRRTESRRKRSQLLRRTKG